MVKIDNLQLTTNMLPCEALCAFRLAHFNVTLSLAYNDRLKKGKPGLMWLIQTVPKAGTC